LSDHPYRRAGSFRRWRGSKRALDRPAYRYAPLCTAERWNPPPRSTATHTYAGRPREPARSTGKRRV